MNLLIQVYKSSRFHCMHQKKSNLKQNMKLTFIALFVAATVNGQDYFENVDKRGGDARFATGVMGAGFNRINNHLYGMGDSRSSFRRASMFGK